ncbi:cytosine permease [Pseudomonas fulva]|uniref:purine-cytosine permease family protein n=1 Tax=Pseudomonas fulva TaxID=47880 RepID=UPI00201E3EC1|nr:cytosine permease [Pseudomonas fulva]UQY33022.1 cytosine permease [Pseudomonas fulva]
MEVENRSIEFIPLNERYGHPRRLFTMWFSANMQVTTLVVGTLGIIAGLNLFWTAVALILGNLIGTFFMAAHSAQGPHLGIPQMIQSRAQFGVVGAGLPLFIVVAVYTLFTAANGVVMRDSVKSIIPVGDDMAIIIFGLVTLIISYVGYELIHKLGAWMSALSGLLFLFVAIALLQDPLPTGAMDFSESGFVLSAFLLTITQATSWTMGFGPYVADYSRYLPANTSARATFWFTYIGNALGATLVMLLGALLATIYTDAATNPGSIIAQQFGDYSKVALIIIVIGVLEINVLNLYSAYMSSATIFSGFKKMYTISNKTKFFVMAVTAAIATLIAIHTQYNFNAYFADILICQIYFLLPWSAINLTDYYLVRKGKYNVEDLFDVDGQYGKHNHWTVAIYLIGVASSIPFMELSFYKSYFAQLIGTDISWVPALIVPAALYLWRNRNLGKSVKYCSQTA